MLRSVMLFGCAAGTAMLDQLSKLFVTRCLSEGHPYEVAAGCGLRRVGNNRGSLILLSTGQAVALWLAVVGYLAFADLLGSAVHEKGSAIGLGLALGGATSNLGDRLARRTVVDFIAIGRWPAFNLADAALSVGLVTTSLSFLT